MDGQIYGHAGPVTIDCKLKILIFKVTQTVCLGYMGIWHHHKDTESVCAGIKANPDVGGREFSLLCKRSVIFNVPDRKSVV